MRTGVAVACALALAGCTSPGSGDRPGPLRDDAKRTREVSRRPAEVVATPAGVRVVPPGPVCVVYETTGGAHGRPRYAVHLTTIGDGAGGFVARRGPGPAVFFELEVESGGRRYKGLAHPAEFREHASGLLYLPPVPVSTRVDHVSMAPDGYLGVQEITADLAACRLTLAEPDKGDRALGGRLVQTYEDGEHVVIDPEGQERPLSQF